MIAQLKTYLRSLIETEVGLAADRVHTEQEEQKTIKAYPAALVSFAEEEGLQKKRRLVRRRLDTPAGKITQTKLRADREISALIVFVDQSETSRENIDGFEEIFLREVDGFTDVAAGEYYTLIDLDKANWEAGPSHLKRKAKTAIIATWRKGVYADTEIGTVSDVITNIELQ